MKATPPSPATTPRVAALRFIGLPCLAGLLLSALQLLAAVPANPTVELRFSEGTNGVGGAGVITTNTGTLAGNATFAQPVDPIYETNLFPAFVTNVPAGTYVPAGNNYSVDFGPIIGNSLGGSHGRAVDLVTDSGPFGGTLGAFPQLTVCGWLNPRDLTAGNGGNRIAFALETAGGLGWDLVQRSASQLSLVINQYNDGSPASSIGFIKGDANLGTNNWVYFAVTYDPNLPADQVKYYFGRHNKLAALDVARTYTPPTTTLDFTGFLTLGNFGAVESARDTSLGGNSRIYRGLLDEIKVYTNAFTLDEVQQAQLNSAVTRVAASLLRQPVNTTVTAGQNAFLDVDATGSGLVRYQWKTNGVNISGETNQSLTLFAVPQASSGITLQVGVSNAVGGVLSSPVTLTVLPPDPGIVLHSFSETTGNSTTNLGALAGYGRVRVAGGFPSFISTNVPAGPFAPSTVHNPYSLHSGITGGNRAIDLTNSLVSPIGGLGSMNGLTICGWLNSANGSYRSTSTGRGTAIINANAGGTIGGFVLGYRDNAFSSGATTWNQNVNGRLVLHVNEWKTDPVTAQASSADTIPINTNLPPENWVFFAVTYDGLSTTDNLRYYFGNANQEATNDVTLTYNKGPIPTSGSLSIGNHNTTGDGSTATAGNPTGRTIAGDNGTAFRGLLDEIKVYSKVLTLAEIREEQKAPALPTLLVYSNSGPNLDLSWETRSIFPYRLQSRSDLGVGSWINVGNAESVSANIHKVTVSPTNATEFFRINR